ncbi:E-selectin-like, partial [Mercenaria mercenaria]|uniref:E-selectin-like n=1 Tax=Mercenaria mercenaria TaxID=6596 RepID=UPI00234E3C7E
MNKSPVLRIFFVMLSAGLSVQGMVNKTQSFDGEEDGTFICNHFCGAKDNETELISPPRFNQSCIPEEIRNTSIYYTEKGSDHVVIKWTDPIARDGDDNSPSVIQVKGIKNGGNFTGALLGKTHTIVYIATDTDGLTDTCFFNFTVIVPSCSKLGNVQNGRYTCTNGTAPGSSCMFECHDGFKTTGTGNATCGYFSEPRQSRQSLVWKNVQQCKRIKCGIPADPENGNLTCTNTTYQTVCTVNCNHGYTAFGPKNIICQANGNWSKATVCISHAPNVTECSPSSCNGHMCLLNDNGTFFCNCSLGWSGPLCENPPDNCTGDICMNGVDGNWSDWSRWSKCSVTCGVGVRLRNRSCDNPPPDIHGKVCQGSYNESSYCENDKCEECPALKQTNESLSFYECKTDTDTGLKTCYITCKNGTIPVLRLEGFQTRCGQETNYYWVPGNVQVPCV